jgi:hypothetical protein
VLLLLLLLLLLPLRFEFYRLKAAGMLMASLLQSGIHLHRPQVR